ncbi:MAG: hypothetical protein K6A98_03865 [Prevotella sp.]|nr:hypothetical protein [Prevotella sp.]
MPASIIRSQWIIEFGYDRDLVPVILKHFIKFGDFNIGRDGDLLTLPTYMQFLLDLEPEVVTLEKN